MSSGQESGSILGEAHQHHLTQVNNVLRRPGMYGRDEMAERLLLEAMAAVDGSLTRWRAECEGLRERGAFTATGVRGAYSNILPADALRDATASVYAEIAHRLGWLELDRALSAMEFRQLGTRIGWLVAHDRTLSEVVEKLGPPSLWIGGTNSFYPKTLAYTTLNHNDGLVCFHLWNAFANTASGSGLQGVHPDPVVLAVRHRPGPFAGSFSFTPEGLRRRPTADQHSPLRSTVWIFHADRARYASAVFTTLEAGLAWAAEHEVTGILAEYAHGGAYEVAVSERPLHAIEGPPRHPRPRRRLQPRVTSHPPDAWQPRLIDVRSFRKSRARRPIRTTGLADVRATSCCRRVVVVPHNPVMVWWRQADCPVRPVEQDWIERSMDWFVAQFGSERLHGEVILPTDDFPGAYRGTREDIRAALERLCTHMDIDPARVDLEHDAADDNPELSAHVPIQSAWTGAAGHHRIRDGRSVIGIRDDQAARPMTLVATIAHELGHVLLLGDGRISAQQQDHEPLTDLLTIFFGLGIFSANAAFEYSRDVRGAYGYARTSRLGYLTEPMYGYGLARYAWLRGEADPGWARYVDTNPRTFLKHGLRYLAQADRIR